MSYDTLEALLAKNQEHVDTLPNEYFDEVQDGQSPAVVSICCSDSRVSQEGMFNVQEPGYLFTPSTIGNQAWSRVNGEKVVDGNLLYPVAHTDTKTIAVVGHTSCGAVTAAYQAATGDLDLAEEPAGIRYMVEMLEPVVAEAIELNLVDTESDNAVNELVEVNVDEQVAFLQESNDVPDDAEIYGLVYDFQGVYGGDCGTTYLINVNGETDPETIRDQVSEPFYDQVKRFTTR